MQLLVSDWQEQISAEQKKRSADLMRAVMGPDGGMVDDCLYACDAWDEVRKMAVALADRLAWLGGEP